jgi:hypothetical protein
MLHMMVGIGFVWFAVALVVVFGLGALIRRAEAQRF